MDWIEIARTAENIISRKMPGSTITYARGLLGVDHGTDHLLINAYRDCVSTDPKLKRFNIDWIHNGVKMLEKHCDGRQEFEDFIDEVKSK